MFLPPHFTRHAVPSADGCFPSLSSAKGRALALRGEVRGHFLQNGVGVHACIFFHHH